jgi:hypothetical protein
MSRLDVQGIVFLVGVESEGNEGVLMPGISIGLLYAIEDR